MTAITYSTNRYLQLLGINVFPRGLSMFDFNKVSGIIFDLDDTLVRTKLDFAALKRDINCPKSDDILTFIDNLPCEKARKRASEIVLAHEIDDAKTSSWMPGAQRFVLNCLDRGLPLAIVTRNCKEATDLKIKQNDIPIELVITREDAPAKPDPTALLNIANQWSLPTLSIAYIGDYIYDIQAAHNANMQAWLFDENKTFANSETCHLANMFAQKLSYISP
jgi:phosphoglycolate phosphatase-like HAD superfamily hydrolase